ncbi:hypothetical protein SAY87_016412 [Trapa incisa]|uniref:Protein kinase domain-containing protein n=1 Tax=Trapa incisa TaxID=236973 RepID=A0AAN7LGX2_9MYRT|nr:hypothetical protein SAY87_016412 [Trapa incisa]
MEMEMGGGEGAVSSGGGAEAAEKGEGGAVVVVGVKLDGKSKELLTWTLLKVAQPGDRVIALHVLDSSSVEGPSSLISLVNAFDSVLAVYEGFCNLKQVNLKLKVCRGPSVKKVLVREAKVFPSAKLVVGISKSQYRNQSSANVAKYCARNLSRSYWVFAVGSGKVVFKRDTEQLDPDASKYDKRHRFHAFLSHHSLSKNLNVAGKCDHGSRECLLRSDTNQPSREASVESISQDVELTSDKREDASLDNSLTLVPFVASEEDAICSDSIVIQESHAQRTGWPSLRWTFLPKRQQAEKSTVKKKSMVQRVLRLPNMHSSAIVHPDQKHSNFVQNDDKLCSLNADKGAIVSLGSDVVCPSLVDNYSWSIPKELEGFDEKYSSICRLFNYEEILEATLNLKQENLVGRGGSSTVYRGCLSDGKEIAVKLLKPSHDVVKEFAAEIGIITTLNHKNIVSLLGFCHENNKLALIYDFLERGSLEENLHGIYTTQNFLVGFDEEFSSPFLCFVCQFFEGESKDHCSFGWKERYKVATGVAEALDYLHNSCAQPVIHKDVKSSNILLSEDFEPHLSDFGFAGRVADLSCQLTAHDVSGTFGYLAPEYFMYGKVSDRVDVYAFGVVILELLSGRKPIDDEYPKGQESLVMWAKPILQSRNVSELLDPSLGIEPDSEYIERMVLAATICISQSPQTRPQISLVLKLLQGDQEAIIWARAHISSSSVLNSLDEEESQVINIQSHLSLALQDLEDDSLSVSSAGQSISWEEYMHGRWSRSSSMD